MISKSVIKRGLFLSLPIILFICISGIYLYTAVLQSADEIISSKKSLTQSAVNQLVSQSESGLKEVWKEHLEGKDRITRAEQRAADSLLSKDISHVLNHFHRVEGGLYFFILDEFIGYSFPTIPPPRPAFGPPPRSYNIIRDQVRATITEDTLLTRLHRFDPAIFPLSTTPVYVDGELIGAAWARIHIERELAASQSVKSGTFFLTTGSILFGLAIAIYFVWILKKRMKEIKDGLEKMKYDPAYRLKEPNGALGFISRAINAMTDAQQKEHDKRKRLERELFQKEKMASLGNVIAGTAHEINTPISIIKTRIQIWERKLKRLYSNSNSDSDLSSLLSDKSLQMVHAEIDRVSHLIKRLLYFSKPAGDGKIPVDIQAVIEERLLWLKDAFPDYNPEFITQWDPGVPVLQGDKEAIDQVLVNILKNAVEASGRPCRLVLRVRFLSNEGEIEIRVRDFGSGIPDTIEHRIFDPFFTTKDSGSGLGLSISGEIIKAHRGLLFFESPEDEDFPPELYNLKSHHPSDTEFLKTKGTVCIIRLPVPDYIKPKLPIAHETE